MIILAHSAKSVNCNMGKNNRPKLSRERFVGSESSEESILGQGCPHVNKAVNFPAMKKSIAREKIGSCKDCSKKSDNKKGQEADQSITATDDYELTLWVCLQCGNQGCDRNSHNKHALKHFEASRNVCHFIVINTTSWSTWCYKCDDEVPVERHKKIIECLDFLKKQAGVPTMALDPGRKETSPRLINDGTVENTVEAKRGKAKATVSKLSNSALNVRIKGLSNLGNTCFFNAVLQNLSQTHGLENILKDGNRKGAALSLPGWQPLETDSCSDISDDSSDNEHSKDNTQRIAKIGSLVWRIFTKERRKSFRAEIAAGTPANCHKYQPPIDIVLTDAGPLTRSLLGFLHEMTTSSNHNSIINPCTLFGQVCKKAPRFKGFQQQDSHELLRSLLDVMRTEEIERAHLGIQHYFKTNPNKMDNKTHTKVKEYCRQAKHTFIDRLFGGHLISTVSCEVCQHMSQIFEPFLDLSLPVTEEKPLRPNLSVGTKKKDSTSSCTGETTYAVDNFAKPMNKYAERKQKRVAKKEAKRKARQARNRANQISLDDRPEGGDSGDKGEDEEKIDNEEENGEEDEEIENEKESHGKVEDAQSNDKEDTSDADIEDNVENDTTHSERQQREPATNTKTEGTTTSIKNDSTETESGLCNSRKCESINNTEGVSLDTSQHLTKNTDEDACCGTEMEVNISELTNGLDSLEVNDKTTPQIDDVGKNCAANEVNEATLEDSNRMISVDNVSAVGKEKSITADMSANQLPSWNDGLEKGALEASESLSKCFGANCNKPSLEVLPEPPVKMLSIHDEMRCDSDNATNSLSNTLSSVASKSSICVAQILSNCSQGPPLAHPEEEDIEDVDDVDEKEYINMSTIKRQAQAKSMSTLSPRYQPTSRECSIMSCLHQFTSAELLTGNNKVRCKNCTRRKAKNSSNNKKETIYTNASKQFLIFRPPAILTLHLKRFEQIGFSTRKVNRHVEFPFILDIAPFCSSLSQYVKKGQKKVLYSLYGIVEHNGRLSGGHYTAYVKVCKNNINKPNNFLSQKRLNPKEYILQYRTSLLKGEGKPNEIGAEDVVDVDSTVSSGKWYHISDSHVREVTESLVEKAQAYLLFYERIY